VAAIFAAIAIYGIYSYNKNIEADREAAVNQMNQIQSKMNSFDDDFQKRQEKFDKDFKEREDKFDQDFKNFGKKM
jgi:hypothetical protein